MPGNDVKSHLEVFKTSVQAAKEMGPVSADISYCFSTTRFSLSCLLVQTFINSHSGKDHFNLEQGKEFFNGALEIQKSEGRVCGVCASADTRRS